MTNENPKSSSPASAAVSFSEKVTPRLMDLLYPSESDEPLEFVTCYLDQEEPLTVSQIRDWQMLPPSVWVEEIPEADFWVPVTMIEDWYDDEEKARTEKFRQLKAFVQNELTVRQVFRTGTVEIDVYLLGRQTDGQRAGLKTKVVET